MVLRFLFLFLFSAGGKKKIVLEEGRVALNLKVLLLSRLLSALLIDTLNLLC